MRRPNKSSRREFESLDAVVLGIEDIDTLETYIVNPKAYSTRETYIFNPIS